LIENTSGFELYDTRADPDERTNQIRTNPPVLQELKKLLSERRDLADRSPFE
jgi:hypothetical protein